MPYVFGPVLSRRLGFSLGVDPVPLKTCNLNCIYCQLGPTPPTRIGWTPQYPSVDLILDEVWDALTSARCVGHVTVSGSGEPTLHPDIGLLVGGIKKMTKIPVAVITNGTSLSSLTVQQALCQADVVLPSLDAAENRAFNRISRPPGGVDVEEIIAGLADFRQKFSGKLWLEVLLVQGMNDTPSQLACLKIAMNRIKPDRIHLNTVVRPPATGWALPVSQGRLKQIRAFLGPHCEVMTDGPSTGREASRLGVVAGGDMETRIVQAVTRRPMTLSDLALSLGTVPAMVLPRLARLRVAGVLDERDYCGRRYYLNNIDDKKVEDSGNAQLRSASESNRTQTFGPPLQDL